MTAPATTPIYPEIFNKFFDRLLGSEGGYVFDKDDPGGETNWGISKRSYPLLDIKNLTREDAKSIYFQDFWIKGQLHSFHSAVAFQMFDAAVNHGIPQSLIFLQKAAEVMQDGEIGPITIAAVNKLPLNDILLRYDAYRLFFYSNLPEKQWIKYSRGWVRRVAKNLLFGADDN